MDCQFYTIPIKRSALGSDEWTLYEQVAVAAMDCQNTDVAKVLIFGSLILSLLDCIKVLQKKFPGSKRVDRLESILLEAKGSWAEAEKAYSSLLEDNPLDQVILKRRAAMAKAQGNLPLAIGRLNQYIEIFMADPDTWRELAVIYVSLQMYKQAAFCYEELILSQPMIPFYHLAYADHHYTAADCKSPGNVFTECAYFSKTFKQVFTIYALDSTTFKQLSDIMLLQ